MHRMLIHRVGVGGVRYFPFFDKLIEEYGKESVIMTTDNDPAVSYFSSKVFQLIDFGTFFNDEVRYKNAKQYKPVDALLIKKMTSYYHNIIEVEGRDRRNENYLSRVNYYYDYLGYWNGFLDEYGVDLYLCESLPHEFHGMLLYYLCKVKGIPTIVTCESIWGYGFFSDNELSEMDESIFKMVDNRAEELLNEDFKATLDKYMDITQDITPYYNTKDANQRIDKMIRRMKPKLWKRLVFSFLYGFQIIFRTTNTKLIRRLYLAGLNYDYLNTRGEANKFYINNISECDFNKKYIYAPLHCQPELSTVPMAEYYENQILIIRMLSKCLPDGYLIYVKEHLGQYQDIFSFPGNRDVNYYKELLSIDKVRLISMEIDTYKLLEKCVCVATATGTAGFEALFRDKQVLLFGGRFFQYAPGVYRVKDIGGCRAAVKKIIESYESFKTDRNLVANFLLKIQKISFYRGISDDDMIQPCGNDTEDKKYAYECLIEYMKKNSIWQDNM